MSSDKKKYTADFKKQVAQEALDQSKKNLDKLSKKYNLPVSVILMWATELEKGGDKVFQTDVEETSEFPVEESVEVDIADQKVVDAVEHGVMLDQLNYKRLIFWSVFGVALVILFVQGVKEMYKSNNTITQEQVSSESKYYQVSQLEHDAEEKLNSFGVVDLNKNIYRIPIDSAISDMAEDIQK